MLFIVAKQNFLKRKEPNVHRVIRVHLCDEMLCWYVKEQSSFIYSDIKKLLEYIVKWKKEQIAGIYYLEYVLYYELETSRSSRN